MLRPTLTRSAFIVIAISGFATAASDTDQAADTQLKIHFFPVRDANRSDTASSAGSGMPPIVLRPGADRNSRGGSGPESVSTSNPPIIYHGGPVWQGTPNLYLIWYGWSNWNGPYADNIASQVLTFFAQNIGGSAYFNTVTTYYLQNGNTRSHVSNSINYAGYITDNYSQGYNLAYGANIVLRAVNNGLLPIDPDGLYVILLSPDVTYSGFCSKSCGFHTSVTVGKNSLVYAMIGNTARCRSSCGDSTNAPSTDYAADGMASILAHEIAEMVTDPFITAWYDKNKNEIADKCAWQFGKTNIGNPLNPVGVWNTVLGSGSNVRRYKLQELWVNYGAGYCALAY